jgi:hypothetical protein
MKLIVGQIGKTIEPGTAKSVAARCFEQRFCGVLIALIFAAVVIASLVLTWLTGGVVERLDGPAGVNSANAAGQEKAGTLQRAAIAAWGHAGDTSKDASQMMLIGKAGRQGHLG